MIFLSLKGISSSLLNITNISIIMRREIISKSKLDKRLDEIDIKIIDLMVLNKTNKEISKELRIPLSTVQRRVRNLVTTGYVLSNIDVNYQKFGFKTGLVHVYLSNGDIEETTRKIQSLHQITYVEIHVGNSDILGNVIYKEGKELLNLISTIKDMAGVERVLWSERVY
jgi:Lrp/AsnC family transcriptional regulator, regulator for asnA, asnC and gidA